jgi:hypothetical protein
MPNCPCYVSAGTQCLRAGGVDAPHMCATHARMHLNGLPERRQDQCAHFVGPRRCQSDCMPNHAVVLCERHNAIAVNAAIRREAQRIAIQQNREARRTAINRVLDEFARDIAAWNWRTAADEVLRRATLPAPEITFDIAYAVGVRYAMRFFGVHPVDYDNYHRWVQHGRQGPEPVIGQPLLGVGEPAAPAPPPRQAGLGQIAADRQNVHTAAVSRQTNDNLERILATSTTGIGSRVVERLAGHWLVRGHGSLRTTYIVADDMQKWYVKSYCRVEGDRLYKRTLDGVFMLIQTTQDVEMRRELMKRLYEECNESVGMCCDGHISRLCNVFVGFDERFKPQLSINEQLQNKIATIAALDVPREMKLVHATAVFDELGVPAPERVAWVEALE